MDWKVDQLERMGATEIVLVCGPFLEEFGYRYAKQCAIWRDLQTGIRGALGTWNGWWTMGDVLLEQPLERTEGDIVFVRPGEQIGGLWLDCGLYYGRGPWRMVPTDAVPHHINDQTSLAECEAYLRGAH